MSPVHRGRGPRRRILATVLVLIAAGCATRPAPGAGDPDIPPWKASASVVVMTAAPDAGGVLSFRNCPTLAEARAAMPSIIDGPDANAVPFKTMVLQCGYGLPGFDVSGRPAGVGVLVFDAMTEGRTAWTWTLQDDWGPTTAIPNLGDRAFATHSKPGWDVWVEAGRFGLHLSHTTRVEIALEPLVALARATVVGLDRPPR